MQYLDVNGARFLAEKLASISLQAGAPAVSRLPPWELPGSREGKVYSEARPWHSRSNRGTGKWLQALAEGNYVCRSSKTFRNLLLPVIARKQV